MVLFLDQEVLTNGLGPPLRSGSKAEYAQAEGSYGVFGDPVALTLTVQ